MKKNRLRIVAISSAATLIALVILSFTLKESRFAPLSSMAPDQVVLEYYKAYDALDMEMMKKLLLPGAGKDDVAIVESVWPASRGALAYGGQLGFLTAAEWIALKRTPRAGMVFGLYGLKVRPLRLGDADYIFEASYSYVVTDTGTLARPKSIEEYARKDEVWLKKQPEGWRIFRIGRVQGLSRAP